MAVTRDSLQAFVDYCNAYIQGDEKSEAQTFLTRFFQAFGHAGIKEVGAEFEERVKKASKKDKTGFADLVWSPAPGVKGVVVEMKKRGTDLALHYSQLEKYWLRLTPKPRYSILCNFDEFWVYDFNNQVDEPVDRVKLEDLPNRVGTFSFMEIGGREPIFRNNQVEVTERTAKRMGEFYRLVRSRGEREKFVYFTEAQLQRFTLQCVLAMFAEDRNLLPRDLFVGLVQDCLAGRDNAYDAFSGLFRAMNLPGIVPQGRYKGVDYFNGGLFGEIQPIPLEKNELEILDVCARDNWANIRPSIFGNIFESAIDADERHARGIHYTSEKDIRQIVRPTIADYWEGKIDEATTYEDLEKLKQELREYRVLDPACGSGNFLYVAYQELKRLERVLLNKIYERRKRFQGEVLQQEEIGIVTPLQFFGMDTNPFAVQLARVTMMIARKIAIDKFGLTEPALPLDSLDQNIVCQDALFNDWPKADAIIGNPPFLGGSRVRLELGDKYVERIFEKFSDVKDKVDFCVYWFRLAHENLNKTGRAGLVGTNSISQGFSRRASLEYIVNNGGIIHDAISTQVWSGQANVHVSLVNWQYLKPPEYVLDHEIVKNINSSLKSETDVSNAVKLKVNLNQSFKGVQPTGKDFLISEKKVENWIQKNTKNNQVLKLFVSASDLASNKNGEPSRWIIDFNDFSLEDASTYKEPFDHVNFFVKPQRENNRDQKTREYWWLFPRARPAMRQAIELLALYFAVPRHSKWFIFIPCKLDWLPADSTTVVASDDFYVLGILTSDVHRQWVKAQSSTLKGDTRYTHNTCFETFPFPQTAIAKLTQQIRQGMIDLHEYRTAQMEAKQWGITKLYNAFFDEPASQLHKLHKKLDALVLKAYGFKKDDDILEKLLDLNLALAEKEKNGENIVGPWAIDNPPK
ncbi:MULTISPECIES: DNA methyltransferase [Cyanophyceae]|uniref:DNA methyltransferase n=1 Tax=Cyanophyceae TaxID=3028117 RepID=UPI00016DCB64|nr:MULTISPECIES: DNA methyltransferase [Cyanophyceae]ACB00292.1 DNA modification methyltransferase [Picosynechococcus sp. PCC 7002]SMH52570.1 Type II restriction/modification system, DNA methylase subunit YeeA [Picosynechococcus sp. OG1]SMQ82347.1 Type II restriction/modification system, DNA methylase subunit YeeA [Synechococcus sp. 7002]